MRWRYALSVVGLALTFAASTSAGPGLTPPAEAMPVREVHSGRITAYVPEQWSFRPMPGRSPASHGLQASGDLGTWGSLKRRQVGLEAYWVDAARVGLPSDYYYLAAEEPMSARLPHGRDCEREHHDVLADRRPLFDRTQHSPGDYVATASGTCQARGLMMRWASFVAAPGFGPVKRLGIPESGLYFALVMIPDGPHAHQRAERLLSSVRFGDTAVGDLIAAARGQI